MPFIDTIYGPVYIGGYGDDGLPPTGEPPVETGNGARIVIVPNPVTGQLETQIVYDEGPSPTPTAEVGEATQTTPPRTRFSEDPLGYFGQFGSSVADYFADAFSDGATFRTDGPYAGLADPRVSNIGPTGEEGSNRFGLFSKERNAPITPTFTQNVNPLDDPYYNEEFGPFSASAITSQTGAAEATGTATELSASQRFLATLETLGIDPSNPEIQALLIPTLAELSSLEAQLGRQLSPQEMFSLYQDQIRIEEERLAQELAIAEFSNLNENQRLRDTLSAQDTISRREDAFNRFGTFGSVAQSSAQKQLDNAARELEANRRISNRYGFSTYLDTLDGALSRRIENPLNVLREIDAEQRRRSENERRRAENERRQSQFASAQANAASAGDAQSNFDQAVADEQAARDYARLNSDLPEAQEALRAAELRRASLASTLRAATGKAPQAGALGAAPELLELLPESEYLFNRQDPLAPFGNRQDALTAQDALDNFRSTIIAEEFLGIARNREEAIEQLTGRRAHEADLYTRQASGGLSNLDRIYDVQRIQAADNPYSYLAFNRLNNQARAALPQQSGPITPSGDAALDDLYGGNRGSAAERQFFATGQQPTRFANARAVTGFAPSFSDPALQELSDIQLAVAAPTVRGQSLNYDLGNRRLALDRELGTGRLELDTNRLALDRELGTGRLDLDTNRLALDRELGTGRLNLDRRQQDLNLLSNPEALGAFTFFQRQAPTNPLALGGPTGPAPEGADQALLDLYEGNRPSAGEREFFANRQTSQQPFSTRRNVFSFGSQPTPQQGFEVGQAAAQGVTPGDFARQVRRNTPNPNQRQRRTRFSLV